MNRELDNILKQLKTLKEQHLWLSIKCIKKAGGLLNTHLFIFAILKRSLDIVDAFTYSVEKFNLNVQVPILRLEIDNCLLLKLGSILSQQGKDILQEVYNDNSEIKKFKYNGKNLSENKLAELISEEHESFKELYKFTCKAVHFTRFNMKSCVSSIGDMKLKINMAIGNKDKSRDILINAASFINVSKILFNMIEKFLSETKGSLISYL